MKKKLDLTHLIFACLCCAAFVVYAVYVNSFGPNASLMMEYFDITESKHGFIITVQSVGGILTAVWLSLFGEKYNNIYYFIMSRFDGGGQHPHRHPSRIPPL